MINPVVHPRLYLSGLSHQLFMYLLIWLVGSVAFAQNAGTKADDFAIDLRQETTHPKIDICPNVSPDGQWMAYVSSRSGNYDIFLRSLVDGSLYQLTHHKADDLYPCWAWNGEALAFVSQRKDAAGDIWLVRFKSRKGRLTPFREPERLTTYLGFDGYPSFSPDSEFLAFVSDRDGEDNIWILQLKTGKKVQLTHSGGTHPSWNPNGKTIAFTSFRQHSKGSGDVYMIEIPDALSSLQTSKWPKRELPHSVQAITQGRSLHGFPCWSPDGRSLAFIRMNLDSNGDGILTPDDNSVLWTAQIDLQRGHRRSRPDSIKSHLDRSFKLKFVQSAMPLTSGNHREFQPNWGADNRIYFTSNRGGNLDIWSVPADGYFPKGGNAKEQFELAQNHFPLPARMSRESLGPLYLIWRPLKLTSTDSTALLDRALAFQRVLDFHSTKSNYSAKALYEIGVCYVLLGDSLCASLRFSTITKEYQQDRTTAAFTEMANLGLTQPSRPISLAQTERLAKALKNVIAKFNSQSEPCALALIEIGKLYYQVGENTKAFEAYRNVVSRYGNERAACAESQIRMGDLFKKYAEEKDVIRAYLNVIENYPDQRRWVDRAKSRILDMLSKNDDEVQDKISRLREIAGQYADFPRVAAAAQLRIGEFLIGLGDHRGAQQEFQSIIDSYPTLIDERVEAQLLLAQTFMKFGESLKAFKIYEATIDDFESTRPDLVQKSKDQLLEALLTSGQYLSQMRDFDLAQARYRRARELFPNNVQAHRGYITSSYYQRRISLTTAEYEQLVADNAKNNVLTYALALCYSYQGTEQAEIFGNRDGLKAELLMKSNSILAKALAQNYSMVHAYLTMSYNYEMLEQHEARERLKPKSFFHRFVGTITAPIVSLYHTLTFYKEPTRQRYYERAISALITGITLNDESADPLLEANMALNLANNYYNLQEFGYERAYEYYHYKLSLDTTFANRSQAALVYERMGHCALVVEDLARGPIYLQKAIRLSKELGDESRVLLNTKRLALLYEVGEDYLSAIQYYRQASLLEEQRGMYPELERSYRSIAYNYWMLGESEDALTAALQAEDLLASGKIKEVSAQASRVKLGFLGLLFPVPFIDVNKMAMGRSSAYAGFTTNEERALVHTILGLNYVEEKDYQKAVSSFNKKLEIYREKKDDRAEAAFLNNIGNFYFLKGDFYNSWQSFEKSLEICKKNNLIGGILNNSINLGRLAVNVSEFEQDTAQCIAHLANHKDTIQTISVAQLRKKAAQHLNDALGVFASPDVIYTRERIQILIALAHLSLLEGSGTHEDTSLYNNISSTIDGFEQKAYARTYFEEALRIAEKRQFSMEESAICMSLGNMFISLYEPKLAIQYLLRGRNIALRAGHYEILWRTDQYLGDLMASLDIEAKRTLHIQKDAFEFYSEAIEVLENQRPNKISGASMPAIRTAHQQLYRKAVSYLSQKGDSYGAIEFAERMRANLFLDMLANEKIDFKKERHKIYYRAAKDIQQQMSAQSAEIRRIKSQTDTPRSQIVNKQKELRELQQEYNQVLAKVNREDPELESFIHVNPIDIRRIQNTLAPSVIVLYYLTGQNSTTIWLLDHTSLKSTTLPIGELDIGEEANRYYKALASSEGSVNDFEDFKVLNACIAPLDSLIYTVDEIHIIPDGSLSFIPFAHLLRMHYREYGRVPRVVISSSLASYYYAYEKRKIAGTKFVSAGDRNLPVLLSGIGYNFQAFQQTTPQNAQHDFLQHISDCDFVYLHANAEWNQIEPLRSQLGFLTFKTAPTLLFPINLFPQNLSSSLIHLQLNLNLDPSLSPEVLFAWERAFIYAGAPALLISLWPVEGLQHQKFLKTFYTNRMTMTVSEALNRAQDQMQAEGVPPSYWAGYQLIGFGGMSETEKRLFAEQGFVGKVQLGNSYYQTGEWADAIRHYEAAYAMAKMRGDSESIDRLSVLIIQAAVNGELYDKAIEYQNLLIQKAQKKDEVASIANGYNNLAFFYTQQRDFDNGVIYKQKYLELADRYHLKSEEAKSLRDIGLIYEHGGQYSRAVEFLQQSLQHFQNLQDTLGIASTLRDLGRIYFSRLDNYAQALEYQSRALRYFKLIGLDSNTIDALQNMGLTYDQMANYRQALQYQQQALDASRSIESQKQEGLSLHYIAAIQWKLGDFQNALQYEKQAMDLFTKLNNDTLNVLGLSLRGLVELSIGQNSKALDTELMAMDIAVRMKDTANQATIHKNIGIIHRASGREDLALSTFTKAAKIDSTIRSKRGLVYDYLNIGSVLVNLDNLKAGRTALTQALALSDSINDRRSKAQALLLFGKIDLQEKYFVNAQQRFSEAIALASEIFASDIEWRAHWHLARAFVSRAQSDEATVEFQKSIEIIEEMRSRIKIEEYKSGFIDDKQQVYGDFILLLLKTNQSAKIFEIVERAKSRNFLDILGNRDIAFSGTVSDELMSKKKNLQAEITEVQTEISALRARTNDLTAIEKDRLEELNDQIEDLRSQYLQQLTVIREANPELADLVSVEPWSLSQVQHALPDSSAIVEFYEANDNLIALKITQTEIESRTLDVDVSSLGQDISNFRDAISRQLSVDTEAKSLFGHILAPILDNIKSVNHLIIIPHGALHYLPFSALLNKDGDSLLDHFSISLAPSATVLGFCLQKGRQLSSVPLNDHKVLAFGNPDLGDPAYDLPFASREIRSVAREFPHTTSFLKNRATETRFINECSKFSSILLSCHGEFNSDNPLFSSLLLASDSTNDGHLEAHEIFGLRLNADIVALSACETGLGAIRGGDEVIGLTRSFIFAGTSSIMSSLWKVDDLATGIMIKRFFRNLSEGHSRAQALRLAQLHVRDHFNAHPAFWAAFTISGDFR